MHEEHDNSLNPRTIGALALRPTGNVQGGYFFFSLTTGKVISRMHRTAIPMPEEVIARVERMAHQEHAGTTLLFEDRDHNEIIDPDHEDDDDDGDYNPDNDNDDDGDDNDTDDDINAPSNQPDESYEDPGTLVEEHAQQNNNEENNNDDDVVAENYDNDDDENENDDYTMTRSLHNKTTMMRVWYRLQTQRKQKKQRTTTLVKPQEWTRNHCLQFKFKTNRPNVN